jgi:hypothetical protein
VETPPPPPSYESLLAAKSRLVPLLVKRMPRPGLNAAFDTLSVPLVKGQRRLRDQQFVPVVLDFALFGMVRHGRNYAQQQLTAHWPADKTERAVLAGLGQASYLFAVVESVKPGEGLTVKDASGAEAFIHDVRFSKSIQPGAGIATFAFSAGGHFMVTGAPFLVNWPEIIKSLTPALANGRVWKLGSTPSPEERERQMEYAASFIATMLAL